MARRPRSGKGSSTSSPTSRRAESLDKERGLAQPFRVRVVIIFLDGVGLGADDPTINPLVAARAPAFDALLDGRRPVAEAAGFRGERASLVGLDASLGVPGTPQSGTGHATLLTGEDGVRRFGRHYGPWVPTALRALVAETSVLARARAAGRRVAFANAYPEELASLVAGGLDGVPGRRLGPLRSGPPLAAIGARVLTRHTPELERGAAVASEITNDGWIERLGRTRLPVVTPGEAGVNLARIAARHDLTLFAHYSTDHVGHRGSFDQAVAAVERVDRFLAGVLEAIPRDAVLFIVSDHGNLEDASAGHTSNPALGLVAGPGHETIAADLRDLRDVAPAVLAALERPGLAASS
jgi:2,3-bisphosphoglycerate-independent phosphoglycerate mutase